LFELEQEGVGVKGQGGFGGTGEDGRQVRVPVEVPCEVFEDIGGQVAVLLLFLSFEVILFLLR
jgi:hypothetical protein